jgi:hypothetical protein
LTPESSAREPAIPASSETGPERPGGKAAKSGTCVVALVSDLMDRSKLSGAIPGVVFSLSDNADVVIIDLARGADRVSQVRASHPDARIVCFGPHVDDDAMAAAKTAGADVVLPRSRFFRDPNAAIA